MMPSRGHLDARLVVVNGIGLAVVVTGWWFAAGSASAGTQVAWLSLSVLGLVLSGGANGLWLTRERRVVTLARARVEALARAVVVSDASRLSRRSVAQPPTVNGKRPAVSASGLLASPAMSYYHRADCLLAAGKRLEAADEASHVAAGRRPCEVCQP